MFCFREIPIDMKDHHGHDGEDNDARLQIRTRFVVHLFASDDFTNLIMYTSIYNHLSTIDPTSPVEFVDVISSLSLPEVECVHR